MPIPKEAIDSISKAFDDKNGEFHGQTIQNCKHIKHQSGASIRIFTSIQSEEGHTQQSQNLPTDDLKEADMPYSNEIRCCMRTNRQMTVYMTLHDSYIKRVLVTR